jgi:basic membrane protein A and related proteins
MDHNPRRVWAALLLAVALTAAACGGDDEADEPTSGGEAGGEAGGEPSVSDLKAAFIYVGPVGDAGWTYRHNEGRKCLEEEGVETAFVESVPETAEVEAVERDFVGQGFDVVFATAFGYQPFTQKVAQENPDVYFFGITPTVAPADNIENFYGHLWDGRYLTGLVAGSMTEANEIGFVAAQPIPTVIAGINAFTLGVREVNPDATVRVVWTLSWFDPPKEKQAAVSLVEGGADVVAQHQDTPSAVQGAAQEGAWAIGSESDMTEFAPDKYLTGTIWDWCNFYKQAMEQVANGEFEAGEFYGGLDDGTVKIAPLNDRVPQDVQQQVEEAEQGLIDGELDYWQGPLNDNQGGQVVGEGETITIEDINNMDWLVEGVEGNIPN